MINLIAGPIKKSMRGPNLRDDSGMYHYDGREAVSVTTVLSPLGSWEHVHTNALKDACAFIAGALDTGEAVEAWRWTGEGDNYTLQTVSPIEYVRRDLARAGERKMKGYKDRGTILHSIQEDYAAGLMISPREVGDWVEDRIFGGSFACTVDECLPGARALWRWFDTVRPSIMAYEVPVFNDAYGYAGRLDGIMSTDECPLFIGDIKSGFERLHMAQIAAYSKAEFFLYADDNVEVTAIEYPMPTGLPGAVIAYDSAADKAGIRYIDVDMLDFYFEELFLPQLRVWKAMKHGPLPKNKAQWVKGVK